jgi:hypothetical protein
VVFQCCFGASGEPGGDGFIDQYSIAEGETFYDFAIADALQFSKWCDGLERFDGNNENTVSNMIKAYGALMFGRIVFSTKDNSQIQEALQDINKESLHPWVVSNTSSVLTYIEWNNRNSEFDFNLLEFIGYLQGLSPEQWSDPDLEIRNTSILFYYRYELINILANDSSKLRSYNYSTRNYLNSFLLRFGVQADLMAISSK